MSRSGTPPRSVCIVMLSAIGDAVHVLPVVTALKRAWPDCRITWVIQPVPKRVAETHPGVDEFILFERRRGLSGFQSFVDIRDALRDREFDLVLNFQVYFKAGVITGLTGGRRRLGFDRARARDANWLFTNERIAPHAPQHVQDQYFEFLTHLGVDSQPVDWQLVLTAEEQAQLDQFYGEIGQPAAALVLGTSKVEKNWNVDGYAELVRALGTEFGLRSVLVGGPSQVERQMADAVLRATRDLPRPPVDALTNDLRRLVLLLDGADLVVSPDTGPLHIARALDRPLVGLYGYTNPKRYGPYGDFRGTIVDGYAEFEGEDYPAEHVYRDGMKRITTEAVLAATRRTIERYVRTS